MPNVSKRPFGNIDGMTTPSRRAKTAATRTRPLALGYVRVSTAEQTESGAGIAAQETALRAEVDRRAWDLRIVTDAGISGGTAAEQRPGLAEALADLEAGEADVLLVSKLDRLSRSIADGAALLERSQREGWGLVALDLGVDTSTPTGEALAGVVLSFARLERRMIGQRTRDALAAKRAAGVRLGRPSGLSDDTVCRIIADREAGMTLAAVADRLNRDGIPTSQGAAGWTHVTVRKVLRGQQADRIRSETAAPTA